MRPTRKRSSPISVMASVREPVPCQRQAVIDTKNDLLLKRSADVTTWRVSDAEPAVNIPVAKFQERCVVLSRFRCASPYYVNTPSGSNVRVAFAATQCRVASTTM
jgi:hypothetical protein